MNSECRSNISWPMQQVQDGWEHVRSVEQERDESLRYAAEPVVMYSITPSIVMQKRKILNWKK